MELKRKDVTYKEAKEKLEIQKTNLKKGHKQLTVCLLLVTAFFYLFLFWYANTFLLELLNAFFTMIAICYFGTMIILLFITFSEAYRVDLNEIALSTWKLNERIEKLEQKKEN